MHHGGVFAAGVSWNGLPFTLLRVAASTVACTADGECALPVTLSMLGIATEMVRLWVPFLLLLPVAWLIGSCGGMSSNLLYGSNVGEGVAHDRKILLLCLVCQLFIECDVTG